MSNTYFSPFFPEAEEPGTRGSMVPIVSTGDINATVLTKGEKKKTFLPGLNTLKIRADQLRERVQSIDPISAIDTALGYMDSKEEDLYSFLENLIPAYDDDEADTPVDRSLLNSKLAAYETSINVLLLVVDEYAVGNSSVEEITDKVNVANKTPDELVADGNTTWRGQMKIGQYVSTLGKQIDDMTLRAAHYGLAFEAGRTAYNALVALLTTASATFGQPDNSPVTIDYDDWKAAEQAVLDAIVAMTAKLDNVSAGLEDRPMSDWTFDNTIAVTGNAGVGAGLGRTAGAYKSPQIRVKLKKGGIVVGFRDTTDAQTTDPANINVKMRLAADGKLYGAVEGSEVLWHATETWPSGVVVNVITYHFGDRVEIKMTAEGSANPGMGVSGTLTTTKLVPVIIGQAADSEWSDLSLKAAAPDPFTAPADATAGGNVTDPNVYGTAVGPDADGFYTFDGVDQLQLTGIEPRKWNGEPYLSIAVATKDDTGKGTATVSGYFNTVSLGAVGFSIDARKGGVVRAPPGATSFVAVQQVSFTSGAIKMKPATLFPRQEGEVSNEDLKNEINGSISGTLFASLSNGLITRPGDDPASGVSRLLVNDVIAFFSASHYGDWTAFTSTFGTKWVKVDHMRASNVAGNVGTLTLRIMTREAGGSPTVTEFDVSPVAPGSADAGLTAYVAIPAGHTEYRAELVAVALGDGNPGYLRTGRPTITLNTMRETDNDVIESVIVDTVVTTNLFPNGNFALRAPTTRKPTHVMTLVSSTPLSPTWTVDDSLFGPLTTEAGLRVVNDGGAGPEYNKTVLVVFAATTPTQSRLQAVTFAGSIAKRYPEALIRPMYFEYAAGGTGSPLPGGAQFVGPIAVAGRMVEASVTGNFLAPEMGDESFASWKVGLYPEKLSSTHGSMALMLYGISQLDLNFLWIGSQYIGEGAWPANNVLTWQDYIATPKQYYEWLSPTSSPEQRDGLKNCETFGLPSASENFTLTTYLTMPSEVWTLPIGGDPAAQTSLADPSIDWSSVIATVRQQADTAEGPWWRVGTMPANTWGDWTKGPARVIRPSSAGASLGEVVFADTLGTTFTTVTTEMVKTDEGVAGGLAGAGSGAYANNLTELNAGEGAKLSSVESGATAGATVGTNVKDGSGTALTPAQVLNNRLEGSVLHIPQPVGGAYSYSDTAVPGAIKITLPVGFTNTMMRFSVEVFDYTIGKTVTYTIAGYTYQPTPAWINVSATMIGADAARKAVRFGYDGSKCCVWIGETTSTWNYPKIRVVDFEGGHSNATEANFGTGWVVGLDTNAPTNVTATVSYPNAGEAVFDQNLLESSGGAVATRPAYRTDLGTSAGLAGAGSGAYANNLSQLNAGEGTKLNSIETGATVGGTVGTNIKNGGGTTLAVDQILNNRVEGNVLRIPQPVGGSYSGGALNTGAIKIALPVSWQDSMITFDVRVYNYATGYTAVYTIGGYLYSSGTTWYNEAASMVGPDGMRRTIRFGHDGSKCCVWIGEPATVWSHPQIQVENLVVGYVNNGEAAWRAGWSVTIDPNAATNVTRTVAYPNSGEAVMGKNILESSGGSTATRADYRTDQGPAAALIGAGSGAYASNLWQLNHDEGNRLGWAIDSAGFLKSGIAGADGAPVIGVLELMSQIRGRNIAQDPEFAAWASGTGIYDNSGSGKTTLTSVTDLSAPNSSGKVLKISYDGTGTYAVAPTPGWGGYYNGLGCAPDYVTSRPGYYAIGTTFYGIIRAKIPVGRYLVAASNYLGDGGTYEFLSEQAGTGDWQWYILRYKIGATNSIQSWSSTGHMYVAGGPNTAFDWYVARHDFVDVSSADATYTGLSLLSGSSGTALTDATIVTNIGTAGALAGAGTGAYANDLGDLDAAADTKLGGVETGADVTAKNLPFGYDLPAVYVLQNDVSQLFVYTPRQAGGLNVSGSSTWSHTLTSGLTAEQNTMAGSVVKGSLRITQMTCAAGYAVVTSTYAGVPVTQVQYIEKYWPKAPSGADNAIAVAGQGGHYKRTILTDTSWVPITEALQIKVLDNSTWVWAGGEGLYGASFLFSFMSSLVASSDNSVNIEIKVQKSADGVTGWTDVPIDNVNARMYSGSATVSGSAANYTDGSSRMISTGNVGGRLQIRSEAMGGTTYKIRIVARLSATGSVEAYGAILNSAYTYFAEVP